MVNVENATVSLEKQRYSFLKQSSSYFQWNDVRKTQVIHDELLAILENDYQFYRQIFLVDLLIYHQFSHIQDALNTFQVRPPRDILMQQLPYFMQYHQWDYITKYVACFFLKEETKQEINQLSPAFNDNWPVYLNFEGSLLKEVLYEQFHFTFEIPLPQNGTVNTMLFSYLQLLKKHDQGYYQQVLRKMADTLNRPSLDIKSLSVFEEATLIDDFIDVITTTKRRNHKKDFPIC